jgi:hypothetical protein
MEVTVVTLEQTLAVQKMNRSLNQLEIRISEVLRKANGFELRHSPLTPQACGIISRTIVATPAEHNTLRMQPQPAEHNETCGRVPPSPNNGRRTGPSTSAASSSPPSLPTNPQPARNASTNAQMCTIEFNNIKITFDAATVPDAPTLTFADDVDALFTEWYRSQKLVVASQGIPIRHWDKFYAKRAKIKAHTWASLRSTWHNWKVRLLVTF